MDAQTDGLLCRLLSRERRFLLNRKYRSGPRAERCSNSDIGLSRSPLAGRGSTRCMFKYFPVQIVPEEDGRLQFMQPG